MHRLDLCALGVGYRFRQLPDLRAVRTLQNDLGHRYDSLVVRVALGQIATLPLVVAGIAVLAGGLGGLYWLVVGMVFSIIVRLFDAWVLLSESNR